MPALAHALPLLETYASEAGSSPTTTAASLGLIPRAAFRTNTRPATCSRMVFAFDWPYRFLAANCNLLRGFFLTFYRKRAERAAYEAGGFLGAVDFGKFHIFTDCGSS